MASVLQTMREGSGTQHPEEIVNYLMSRLVSISGVFNKDNNHFLVEESDTPAMSVDVRQGYAFVRKSNGQMAYPVWLKTEDATVAITANASGNQRIDAIVLYIDLGASANPTISNVAKLIAVAGTPAGSPTAPDNTAILAAIGASNPYAVLAHVTVDSGETTILDADISDQRTEATIAAYNFTVNTLLNLATGVNIKVNSANPYRTISLPAASLAPTTTAGCAELAKTEAGTNDVDYRTLDFDTTTQEYSFVHFQMPDSWDGGTIKAKFTWTAASGSGGVAWGCKGRAYANDDAIDQAYGTEQLITDTLITAADIHETDYTPDITLAGSPLGGQWVQLKVYRIPGNGSDTLGVDAKLIGVTIKYSVKQFSD